MTNSTMYRMIVSRITTLVFLATVVLAAACSGDSTTSVRDKGNAHAFWSLTLNYRGANLSTDPSANTLQLVATPRQLDGTPYVTNETISFISTNPVALPVDSTGLVTALESTIAQVIATLKVGNITHVDTIQISVTEGPPADVAYITIARPSSDNFPIGPGIVAQLQLTAFDTDGNDLGVSVLAACSSSVEEVGQCTAPRPGMQSIYGRKSGTTKLTFIANVFGKPFTLTRDYTVGPRQFVQILLDALPVTAGTGYGFSPNSVTVGSGAVLMFQHTRKDSIDIVFDDSVAVKTGNPDSYYMWAPPTDGGNIRQLPGNLDGNWEFSGTRSIYTPGTYRYRNPATGASGVVVVVAQ